MNPEQSLIWIATFSNAKNATPIQKAYPWSRLVELLSQHEERAEKDGPLFSPTLYKKGTRRGKQNVQTVTLFGMDFDDGVTPEELAAGWSGYEYLIYSTYSHRPDRCRWRVFFPLRESVKAEDWPRIHRNLVTALGGGHPDPVCKDASRIYYLPSCAPGAERFVTHHAGAWLDPYTFPEVEAADPFTETPAPAAPIAHRNGRINPEDLVNRAVERCHTEGRNPAGLWLACQLRDNLFNQAEAEAALLQYHGRVPAFERVYTWDEALHSLNQAYSAPARAPWEQSRPLNLNGGGKKLASAPELPEALGIAQEAVAKLKEDKGAIFEAAPAEALAHLRRWDPANWQRLQADIKKAGINLKELAQVLDKLTPPEEEAEAPRPRYAGDMLDECPAPQLIIPLPYALKENAVSRIVDTDGGSALSAIAYAPILIAGRAQDSVTHQESLLLTWKRPGERWRFRMVERENVIVSRNLGSLAGIGFPLIDEHAKPLATYLTKLEATNLHTLPCQKVSSHLGWQGKPQDEVPFLTGAHLVLPTGQVEAATTLDTERPDNWKPDRVMFHGVGDGEAQIVGAFHSRGSRELWADAVRQALPFPRMAVMFYASFCAPLLKLFNVANFVVDLSHATTTGKTTSLRLAASVWGCPNDSSPETAIYTWDLTRVFLERLSSICSGVPVFLDDTKRARNDKIVAEVIYEVVSGRGRGRGTLKGIAQTASWQTVLFSTGEQPATSFTQDGGARTRVLSIRGLPFGDKGPEVGGLAKRITRSLCANYGHAGLRFMSWLMQERDKWDHWRTTYEQWVEYYSSCPSTPEAGRLAAYAALITVAGAMAHQALPELGEFTNPMEAIWPEVSAEASDAAGGKRALQDVVSWAHSNERTFHGRTGADLFGHEKVPVTMSGRWDAKDWECLAFYPTVLKRILTEQGYHPESILVEWRDAGWLDCLSGSFTQRVRVGENTPRMIKIKREAIDGLDEVSRNN